MSTFSVTTEKKEKKNHFLSFLHAAKIFPHYFSNLTTKCLITLVVNSRQRASLVELHGCGGAHGEPWGHGEASRGQAQGDIASSKELVGLQLGDGRPLGGIGVQHPFDKRGCSRVDVLQREVGRSSYNKERFRSDECTVYINKERLFSVLVELTQGMV